MSKAPAVRAEKKEFLFKRFGTNFMTTRNYKKASSELSKRVQKDQDILGVDDLMKQNVLKELGWNTTGVKDESDPHAHKPSSKNPSSSNIHSVKNLQTLKSAKSVADAYTSCRDFIDLKKDLIYTQYKMTADDTKFETNRLISHKRETRSKKHIDTADLEKCKDNFNFLYLEKKISDQLKKEEDLRLKLQKTVRRKVNFDEEKPMWEILSENRQKLLKDGLSKEERYALRRENLVAIQGKFFEVMEANPEIFKIPCLQIQRKKILKERKHHEFEESDKIEFE